MAPRRFSAVVRLRLLPVACAIVGATAVALGTNADDSAARKPNVLVIVSEDNGPQLSCYGDSHVETPNLDKLAAEGVRFERALVATASCSESRSAILTGLYESTT